MTAGSCNLQSPFGGPLPLNIAKIIAWQHRCTDWTCCFHCGNLRQLSRLTGQNGDCGLQTISGDNLHSIDDFRFGSILLRQDQLSYARLPAHDRHRQDSVGTAQLCIKRQFTDQDAFCQPRGRKLSGCDQNPYGNR